ncbi:hypothetical protein CDG81_19055 [Actinopolyspora erythraea]|uniref:Uncharacterized protein n=2 Tax=Actinopolyspora erythraea TaxID=414996 RepID=A0A223RVX7_9ACTN|nr:hypothetical protein CDG81_19055 [Actinopolyspora erythraea]
MERAGAWLSMLAMMLLTTGVPAQAATGAVQLRAQATPLDAFSTPVGVGAVVFGVIGMIAGTLRRKKAPVQPENQRRS